MKLVYPVDLGNWNLNNRFIIPVIYSEEQDENSLLESSIDIRNTAITDLVTGRAFGLAEI